jgi:transposase-like protein
MAETVKKRHWINTKWRNTKKLKCPYCRSVQLARDGVVKGKQRFLCKKCGHRTIVPRTPKGGDK